MKVKTYTITQNGEKALSITITVPDGQKYSNIQWDSQTGLVTAEINGIRQLIPYDGLGCGKLEPAPFEAEGIIDMKYSYWYC